MIQDEMSSQIATLCALHSFKNTACEKARMTSQNMQSNLNSLSWADQVYVCTVETSMAGFLRSTSFIGNREEQASPG